MTEDREHREKETEEDENDAADGGIAEVCSGEQIAGGEE